ncbi:hypothetical protein BUALT_Bualt11G0121400 [Buddleja alternifolia]|uniref:Reverse transcriptase zinc-binding domain-containing protein n=1 Tax=Buddleja alternifolia TaxID=168488 RepID=A0AAV6WUG9_9LAMI|nr:hypothetical protein BUALT_Bualt11G0121400 [Buddleja alternifolia]
MYADDLLIFGRASLDNATTILSCIEKYEEWSGQITNKDKSTIHFSKNINRRARHEICNLIHFRECNHNQKHLGLPFCKPATKIADYNELLDRVGRKLSGWKTKCLAQVGRNVLVKGVAQSIPIYFLSLYKIPKAVCDRLDRQMRNFWWGDRDDKRHIRLTSWNLICSPKEFGSLGLRRTHDMNCALVNKLAWKICSEDQSLWTTLLKSKYLCGGNFLDQNIVHYNASKIWRSILGSKDSIAKGFCFTVAPNSHIRTWLDPWIPSLPGFSPSPEHLSNYEAMQSSSVEFFMDRESITWDVQKINRFFSPLVANEIMKIRIPTCLEPRRALWIPSTSGKFTVSSSYFEDQHQRFLETKKEEPGFWKRLWKAKIHDRFKMFLWRVALDILPTGTKLHRFIRNITPRCVLCGGEISESANHLFLSCQFSRAVWWRSKWGLRLNQFSNGTLIHWINFILDKENPIHSSEEMHTEFLNFAVIIMDLTWRTRNDIIHGKPSDSVESVVRKAETINIDHSSIQIARLRLNPRPADDPRWIPPMNTNFSVSVDATFQNDSMCSGIFVKNHEDSVVFCVASFGFAWDACDAECRALLEASMWLKRCNISEACFFSDCLKAIEMEYENRYMQVQKPKYDCLLFDLDDTLYPLSTGLASSVLKNIQDYMIEKLGIEESKIPDLCNLLYKNYGTTMAGLRAIGYDFDYDEYHSFVHGRLPYENLKPDPVLRSILLSLPIRKLIFTNADRVHAIKALRRLGLEDCFEGIICFETLNPTHKSTASDDEDDIEFLGSTQSSTASNEIFDIIRYFSDPNIGSSGLPKTPIVCKPLEYAIEKALKIANINPHSTLFFEDSVRNIQSGKRVGLHTVLIGKSQRVKGADYAIESIHNLREAIPELWEAEKAAEVKYSGVAVETSVTA